MDTLTNKNIIQFPLDKIKERIDLFDSLFLNSMNQERKDFLDYKIQYGNELANFITTIVLRELERGGTFDEIEDMDEYMEDILLVFESIRSLFMATNGIEHSLQKLADEYFIEEEDDDIQPE